MNIMHSSRAWRFAAAAGAAAALAATPAAHAATPFTFARGSTPDIAVDSVGTAHLPWSDSSVEPDAVVYCRIPRGATACQNRQVLSTGTAHTQPYVLLTTEGHVVVVPGAYACHDGTAICTIARRSTDGGLTFGAAQLIADTGSIWDGPQDGAVYGPGDSVSMVTRGNNRVLFVNGPLSGSPASEAAELAPNCVCVPAVGISGATPVVVWHQFDKGLFWRNYDGSGSLNDANNWTSAAAIGPQGYNVVDLAGGPKGLFLLSGTSYPTQFEVRRFTGTGWTAPVGVSPAGSFSFPDLDQDSSGRLHVVYYGADDDTLYWRTSTDAGATWSAPVAIAKQDVVEPRNSVAAASDGQGFAIWEYNPPGTPGIHHDLRGVPLEPLGTSKADPCQLPNCQPAGGTFVRRDGGTEFREEVEIPSCQTRKVTLRLKLKKVKRTGNTVVKVKKVVFRLDRQKRKRDKRPPYKVKYSLKQHGLPNSLHTAKAKVHYTVKKGKQKPVKKTLKLKKRFRLCPLA